jgi:hypothetical protein
MFNTPRVLDFFASLHLTIFERPATAENWQSAASAKKSRPLMYFLYTARPGFFCFLASHHF